MIEAADRSLRISYLSLHGHLVHLTCPQQSTTILSQPQRMDGIGSVVMWVSGSVAWLHRTVSWVTGFYGSRNCRNVVLPVPVFLCENISDQ